MPPSRYASYLSVVFVLMLLDLRSISAAQAPEKTSTMQQSLDFERPRPGEMLANPAHGVGSPPSLVQFEPATTMDVSGSGQDGPPPTIADAQLKVAGAPARVPVQLPPSAVNVTAPLIQPSPAQIGVAESIVLRGIDGVHFRSAADAKRIAGPKFEALMQTLRRSAANLDPSRGISVIQPLPRDEKFDRGIER